MAINQVQAIAPRQEQRAAEPREQKKDWVDRVMEGLQIAGGISGLAVNYQTIQKYRADRAMQDDKLAGRMTAADLTELQKTHDLGDSPLAGSVKVLKRDEQGNDSPLYASFRQRKADQDVISITTPGADGRPVTKLVPKVAGSEFPAYEKPEKGPKDITVQERNTLQNQYDRNPTTRANAMVLSSYEDARELIKDPSPASDQALIISYVKAFDPTSVVKESEAETAQAMGSLEARAKAKFQEMTGGGKLTPDQRADLFKQIQMKAKNAAERQSAIDKQFQELSARRQVDARDLRFTNIPKFEDESSLSPPPDQHPQAAAAKAWAEKNLMSPDPDTAAKAREILNRVSAGQQNGSAKNG